MGTEKTYYFYYDFLKNAIDKYRGSIEEYFFYLPDLFKVLTGLLDQRTLKANDRKTILCTLGYLVAPNDVIPEKIHGPAGYVDDIFICSWVLQDILTRYGKDFISAYWEKDEDPIDGVIELCLNKAKAQLKEIAEDVLEYAGIKDDKGKLSAD